MPCSSTAEQKENTCTLAEVAPSYCSQAPVYARFSDFTLLLRPRCCRRDFKVDLILTLHDLRTTCHTAVAI